MIDILKIENANDFPKLIPQNNFTDFLYTHLGKYRDTIPDITKAIHYAFSEEKGKGGFLLIAMNQGKIIGGAVVNNTGMAGYIPEHILVFIATHQDNRGKGVGTKIIEKIISECSGDIALHVEHDNPARGLYKKMGFNSKYIEMRYKQ
jgi:GNAT superfamily N-acetyltransferase